MSNIEGRIPVNAERALPPLDDHTPIWGAQRIGETVGKTEREAYYLLERGLLPATKVGRQWVSTRGKLRAAVGAA
ncbi:MAG TPA: hypothetical protein VJY34_08850 [Roseiarcus sp.]|nr:hypothetical protein [Roseiarcus sp.]